MSTDKTAHFLLLGQSNIDQYFKADGALDEFERIFLEKNPEYTSVKFYDCARGGSSILRESAELRASLRGEDNSSPTAKNFWYDEYAGKSGPTFDTFKGQLSDWSSQGIEFTGILFSQGESDTPLVQDQATQKAYKEGLDFLFTTVKSIIGNAPIYIQDLGDRSAYNDQLHGGTDDVRTVQREYASTHDGVYVVTTTIDLELRDSVHLTEDGYHTGAERLAEALSGNSAPVAIEATQIDDKTIFVKFEIGTNQLRVEGGAVNGFEALRSDGSVVKIDAINRVDSETLAIEVSGESAGEVVQIRYAHQSLSFKQEGFLTTYGDVEQPALPFILKVNGKKSLSAAEQKGKDYIVGTHDDDRLVGDRGENRFITNGGSDKITGGGGEDDFVLDANDNSHHHITDFEGKDHIILKGGLTRDDLIITQNGDDAVVTLSDGSGFILEGVHSGSLAAKNFWSEGTDGHDILSGSSQDDFIFAKGGDDTIGTSQGTDRYYGGAGANTYVIKNDSGLNIIYDFDPDKDTIIFEGYKKEALTFREYNGKDADIFASAHGDSTRVVLRNTDISDVQSDIAYTDILPDGTIINGTTGRDELTGSDGNDIFIGNGDTDGFRGGGGADVFTLTRGDRLNIVRDFDPREDDIAFFIEPDVKIQVIGVGSDTQFKLSTGDRMVLRDIDPDYFGGEASDLSASDIPNILFARDPREFEDNYDREKVTGVEYAEDFFLL